MKDLIKLYKGYRYLAKIRESALVKERKDIMEVGEIDYDFNEKFLQVIWNEQKIRGDLKTIGGRCVKIISSGIWNSCAGPDFSNGVILIDGKTYSGDIEIHKRRGDWYRHGHDRDTRYENVVLHVIWEDDTFEKEDKLATLELKNYIDSEWKRVLWELEDSRYAYCDKIHKGGCALRWAMTEDERVRKLLEAAGLARFGAKSAHLMNELQSKESEKVLIEAMFEVMGYKNNKRQFRMIAEALDISQLQSRALSDLEKEALVFGTGNMLPDMTKRRVEEEFTEYVSELWDAWWRIGQKNVPRIEWDNSESRPYNRPWRRLAAALEILEITEWSPFTWLMNMLSRCETGKELMKGIGSLNNAKSRFREYGDFCSRIKPAADLLGKERVGELTCNAILPFISAVGTLENNKRVVDLAKSAFMLLPPRQENRLIKEACARFLTPPGRVKELVRSTCHQQGLLDIYKNFCLALDNNCEQCPFCSDTTQNQQDAK